MCRTMPWKKDLQAEQRKIVFIRKIWKSSWFDWSFKESWGNPESFREPVLKLGTTNEAGMKPGGSRIHFPQMPNHFVPRFSVFFFIFKGQKTQPLARAEDPFLAARRRVASQSHSATHYINPGRQCRNNAVLTV